MKKIFYNKLVRDAIPDTIKRKGSDCEIRVLNKRDFERALLAKVGEEASGLVAAKGRKELISELADVLDVIEAIQKVKKISDQEVREAQKIAFQRKGGFDKRVYLVWSSDDGYTTNEKTSKKRS